MTLTNLLGLGYFNEELPPPFNSKLLGSQYHLYKLNITAIPKKELPKDTLPVNYFAPKTGIYRRQFSIPHPFPQIKLSEAIVENWRNIFKQYSKSEISISIPEIDISGQRAIIYLNKFELFRESAIKASSTKQYQLHLDISKYFYSIYTHSIPWAIHSKIKAKADHSFTLWGNQIDTYVRLGQSNQTKGIPVGTDTSRIIAELIGCEIDHQFKKIMNKYGVEINGCRFVDDCRYYFESLSNAELGLKEYQKILSDYSLNLNDDKTSIKLMPCNFDHHWKSILNSLPLERKQARKQRSDLKIYFNALIKLAKDFPKDSVIKYGIQRIMKLSCHRTNIDIFEALLFNISLLETGILPETLQIMMKYKPSFNMSLVKKFIISILNQNIHRGHHFEIAWALWMSKCFSVKIPKSIAQDIVNSRDVISIIILFDLVESKMISGGKLNFSNLLLELDKSSLSNEMWLLAYEVEYHKWLPLTNISKNSFFKALKKSKVYFYDPHMATTTSKSFIPKTTQTVSTESKTTLKEKSELLKSSELKEEY